MQGWCMLTVVTTEAALVWLRIRFSSLSLPAPPEQLARPPFPPLPHPCHVPAVPWVRAILRGQKIYARADEDGRLLDEGGRVEIRYKPNDGRKYGARLDNLKVEPGAVLPDDACGPAESVEKKEKTGDEAGKPSRTAGKPGTSEERKAAAKIAHEAAAPPPAGHVIAYADGACSGNPGPAGLGVVVVVDGKPQVKISEYLGEGTNNIAELTAILRALAAVTDRDQPMTIFTDSKYAIGVLQQGWKAKANAALISQVKDELKARGKKVLLKYVPGHSGVAMNEVADELAREAVQTRRTRRSP
jgi:ribonuclease HI